MKKTIITVLAILIVGFIAIKGRGYYNSTYVGNDYFVLVPADQDTEVEEWQSGQYTIRGRKYSFTAYNENGQSKIVEFSMMDSEDEEITSADLLQPGDFLKVYASQNRVIKWSLIPESEVPAAALKALQSYYQ